MDSARARVAAGRHWHAAAGLRGALPGGPGEEGELLILLAEAEGGWGNWREVESLLRAPLTSGRVADSRAWFLLGRSLAEAERWVQADSAFDRAQAGGGGQDEDLLLQVHLWRARVRGMAGDVEGALWDLRVVLGQAEEAGEWLALELAGRAASRGEPEPTLTLLEQVERPDLRRLGWDLPALALLAGGDSAGAEAAYWSALPSLPAGERARGWERVGSLRLARRDSLGARAAYHRVLEEAPAAGEAREAARRLLALGFDSSGVALAGAGVLARAGENREAMRAWDAYASLQGAPLPARALLARAEVQLALGEGTRALEVLDPLAGSADPEVGGSALVLSARVLRRLGRGSEARQVEDDLVERFPNRPEAVEVLFGRAASLESQGDRAGAVRAFRAAAELSPAQNRAGEARMRAGQLLLAMGRDAEAVGVFREYLRSFPEGRRWDQAAFWAGRTLLTLGDREEGESLLRELTARFALSYYSVEAVRLLGEGYDPPVPSPESPPPFPAFLREGLALVDRLMGAGLEEGAAWEVARLTREARALPDGEGQQGSLLRLALELNQRGLTREGINLGWELRRLGRSWDMDLLSAVYPFPYRELILAEAAERGLDPYLMAGLIRQESAFWAQARSRADAMGLMQILPATGADLARSVGPRGFEPETHLYGPEINVHLGMAFFSDLRHRFGEALPILLSAYNAGPSRALRWREYPEAGDWPRFVERIPFEETRGYVKAVTLNREVYAWLYGQGDGR